MEAFALPILAVSMIAIVIWGRVDAVRNHREERDRRAAALRDRAADR